MPVSIQDSNFVLPNSNETLVGPFQVPAGSSVTLEAAQLARGPSSNAAGTFALLSQDQLAGGKPVSAAAVGQGTPAQGEGPGNGLIRSAVAGPNISKDNQPVHFYVDLNDPAGINLSLFTLVGEKVFDTRAQGVVGMNDLEWNVRNNAGQSVASGLYLYFLRVDGNGAEETRTGKILVIH